MENLRSKIKDVFYRHSVTLTLQGIIKDDDEWLWEGEFDKVIDEVLDILHPKTTPIKKYLIKNNIDFTELEDGGVAVNLLMLSEQDINYIKSLNNGNNKD